MGHLKAYDSFNYKRSKEAKERIKKKSKKIEVADFWLEESLDYGIVVEVRYHEALVYYQNNYVWARLRKDINLACNQVLLPGDKVKIDAEQVITHLLKRTTLLARVKKDGTRLNDSGNIKAIAANIDLAIIVAAVKNPPLHPRFIDRYLMVLQNSQIPAILVLNKWDLGQEDEVLKVYQSLGMTVLKTSVYHEEGIRELKKHLLGKTAVFVGPSGVGKSSLIRAVVGDELIKVSNISEKSGRGRHTTTASKYYVWAPSSAIIDTPGIRSLDVSSFRPEEIQEYFLEFRDVFNQCKYHDCLHYHEKIQDCAIKRRVISKEITKERYVSYLKIMGDLFREDRLAEILKEMEV